MVKDEAEVTIRRMTEADLDRIKDIDRVLVGPDRALSWPLRVESQWWVYRPLLNFVAEIGDTVVGFLLGDIRGAEYGVDTSGWIDMMGVAPDYQGRAIGRKLVEAFCEECQRNEVKVRVIIREDDKRLISFWKSLGLRRGKMVTYER